MKNKTFLLSSIAALGIILPLHAEDLPRNTAQMQAMDKITGRVSIIEVPVGGEVHFGSFSVVVRDCKTRPESEIPENFAFVDVTDKSFDQAEYNIFKGWMFSSRPAVHAVEHPIYDVWLLKCINNEVNTKDLMTEEQLKARDMLPRLEDVRRQQEEMKENNFEKVSRDTIEIKDSIYKDDNIKHQEDKIVQQKEDGAPENLLNIKDSYEVEEELIVIPSEDLSQAIEKETENLIEKADKKDLTIEDDLSAAIDRELAEQAR